MQEESAASLPAPPPTPASAALCFEQPVAAPPPGARRRSQHRLSRFLQVAPDLKVTPKGSEDPRVHKQVHKAARH